MSFLFFYSVPGRLRMMTIGDEVSMIGAEADCLWQDLC